jgi:hypothetical protein
MIREASSGTQDAAPEGIQGTGKPKAPADCTRHFRGHSRSVLPLDDAKLEVFQQLLCQHQPERLPELREQHQAEPYSSH